MIDHPYFIALYGWIFFNIILLGLAKDKQDNAKLKFKIASWWKSYWDNILVTFFAIPIIVWFSSDLWVLIVNNWLSKDWEYNRLALLGAVPLVQLIYFLIRKLGK